MNAVRKQENTPETLQNRFNLTFHIRRINFHRGLSNGAKVVGVHLLIAAGHQGFTRLSIKQLGWETNTRLTQLHAYIRELVDAGVLERQAHSGRVNTWIIPEVRALALKRETPSAGRMTIFKSTFKENVQEPKPKANVVSFQPPEQLKPEPTQTDPRSVPAKQTNEPSRLLSTEPPSRVITPETQDNVSKPKTRGKPVQHYLIREILNLTNDKKSFGLWYKFVSKCDEQTVYQCISALRTAIDCDQVNHRGAYLTGIIKRIAPEVFQGEQTNYKPPAPKPAEPIVERDDAMNIAEIRKIREMLELKSPECPDGNRLNQTRTARVFELSNG